MIEIERWIVIDSEDNGPLDGVVYETYAAARARAGEVEGAGVVRWTYTFTEMLLVWSPGWAER